MAGLQEEATYQVRELPMPWLTPASCIGMETGQETYPENEITFLLPAHTS